MTETHKDLTRAIRYLAGNARAGNILSQHELYECYLTGKDFGEKNIKEANAYLDLLRKSMAQARFSIRKLDLYEFRRYRRLSMEFDPNLTVIIGKNGAGKTSVVDEVVVIAIRRNCSL